MKYYELRLILDKHIKWLNGEGEEGGERANLNGADLSHANLCRANLSHANLSGVNLNDANLNGVSLSHANLRDANLNGANLRGANLSHANLSHANLRGANLNDANLNGANLNDANLNGVSLNDADLSGVNLDYSCLPLWCGSLSANFDDKQLRQIAYHLVKAGLQSKNASAETKGELSKLIDLANGFHRVKECGIIVKDGD